MEYFTRDNGKLLRIVSGFRERFRYFGSSVNPKSHWTNEQYEMAARKKIHKIKRRLDKILPFVGSLDHARILEVGCGAGIDCIFMALRPFCEVVGIDRRLRLFEQDSEGERNRRLVQAIFEKVGLDGNINKVLRQLPIRFLQVDTKDLPFPDNSFDFLFTRSALEHFIPIKDAISEMVRVVAPGGFMFHEIDTYYWYRGCHRGALVDIPWAHARLSMNEYYRFVFEHENEKKAQRRISQLKELNHFTLKQWRNVFEKSSLEILFWEEQHNETCETILAENPDVTDTLLDGVSRRDLVYNRIKVLLRNNGTGK
jgi:ubiquinone/menaquinone biosynthesis C-methylase UbiE